MFAAVKDWSGHLSGTPGISYVRGKLKGDTLVWNVPKHNSISARKLLWDDGEQTLLHHLERPFVLRDAGGVPTFLFAAACVGNPFQGDFGAGPSANLPFNLCIPLSRAEEK